MEQPATLSPQLAARAHEIYLDRRKVLYVTADRTFLLLLPVQWLGGIALSLLRPHMGAGVGLCVPGLGPWTASLLGATLNGIPFVWIHSRPGHVSTRYAIAASQALFYVLLMYIAAGAFDTRLYVFVSLALLTFYRNWRLLFLVGGAALVAQYGYIAISCGAYGGAVAPDTGGFVEFGCWVLLEASVLAIVCNRGTLLFRNNAQEAAQLESERRAAYQQALDRARQLEASNEQHRALLESTSAIPWELDDATGVCTYIGAQVERQWGWTPKRFRESGFLFTRVHPDDRPAFAQALEDAVASHDVTVECRMSLVSDKLAHVRSFIRHAPGGTVGRIVRGFSIDITSVKKLESELHQAQKLESIVFLAAGIAHEINTPVQFINDNCYFLRDAVRDIGGVLSAYRDVCEATAAGTITAAEALERARGAEQAADISFLTENVPTAVTRSLEGLERVATIVRSMKEFSHPAQDAPSSADLNSAIQSTLTIALNEYKYVADVETHLEDIPPVVCYVGEFNQVLLNLIVNAAHAIREVVAGTQSKGLITVRTREDGDNVVISVQDTGNGIPEGIQDKIFDPFFTTKEVGKGTGQGLSIARSVIVDKHRGSLKFETERGAGTTFFIRMPVDGPHEEEDCDG
jgi:signal transduction histidine kinase